MGLTTLIHSTPHFAEEGVKAYLFISLESMKGETTRTDLEKTEEATDLEAIFHPVSCYLGKQLY